MLLLYHWEWNQVHREGTSIQSLVTYLRYTHAISYERLSSIFASVFGLKISEGAIANLLGQVKTRLDDLCNSNTTTVAAGKINLRHPQKK
ncbi:MAG: transposase [Microcoleus sp. PH2017_10_PVI_O_A]|nr:MULTISPECIES: transposase [unclassified Microcoleus]MCC3408378.1 transposase [Microcoleus sp. PH2017_10_PVI_O_A]MCC3480335.1 transposase [Microcoleus sp. PH2017_12_PCY_D_A]MCC3527081.1 transposase [Microcoleus sp. PH2017_21_RUC_O_A]MCC3540270.1 transposase [Microcoleus sp. PH2017_22_RUC_O_B]